MTNDHNWQRKRKGNLQCKIDYQILRNTFNIPTKQARKMRYWSWHNITTYLNDQQQIPNLPTTRQPLTERIALQ